MPRPSHAGLGNQYSDTRAVSKADSDPGGYLRLGRFHRKAAAVARAKIPQKKDVQRGGEPRWPGLPASTPVLRGVPSRQSGALPAGGMRGDSDGNSLGTAGLGSNAHNSIELTRHRSAAPLAGSEHIICSLHLLTSPLHNSPTRADHNFLLGGAFQCQIVFLRITTSDPLSRSDVRVWVLAFYSVGHGRRKILGCNLLVYLHDTAIGSGFSTPEVPEADGTLSNSMYRE